MAYRRCASSKQEVENPMPRLTKDLASRSRGIERLKEATTAPSCSFSQKQPSIQVLGSRISTLSTMAPKKQASTSGAGQKLDVAGSDSTSMDASQELDPGKVQDVINRHNERVSGMRDHCSLDM